MASRRILVIIVRHHITLFREEFIHTKGQDPVMQNATCENKLNLGAVRMEWLLIKDLESVLQSSEDPLYRHSEARVSQVENLLRGPGIVP